MNSLLLSLASLLVLALSAAFAGPHFVDWNSYRDVFEVQASRLVGRAVEVQGDVQLALLPTPVLSFEKVRLADANGSFETPLAEAQSFTAWLSVPPLLRGAIEAREIELHRPVLNLHIDGDGSASWSDLGNAGVGLPFMPSHISLASVRITDGRITVVRGADAPMVFEALNGDLSATSLDGPFKFAGTFSAQGKSWTLRFSTGRRFDDVATRLKGVLHDAALQQSYSADGVLENFTELPKFKGRLLARFARGGEQLADEVKPGQEAEQDAALEVKTEVDADLVQASLSEIEATLRRNNRPHTINGSVQADWRDGLGVQANLTGRWFDLDALVGTETPQPPASALAGLARGLSEHAAALRRGRLQLSLEQAVLGGDVVKGLWLDVSRDAGGLQVAQLAGEAPGKNFVELAGALDLKETQSFSGRLGIEGHRLSRLLRWLGAEAGRLAATEAGDYSVQTQISAGPGFLELEQAEGDVLGTAFSGDLRYRSGDRPEFDLAFTSTRLDLERLLGSEVTLSSLRSLIAPKSTGEAEAQNHAQRTTDTAPADPWLSRVDAKVDLNIGAVRLPKLGETSLTAKLQLIDGGLFVEDVHLASDTSLDLQAEGRLASVARQPEGLLTLNIKAAEAAGLEGLARFLELPEDLTPAARIRALSPIDVTLKLQSNGGGDQRLEALAHGAVGNSAMQARLGFTGNFTDFAAADIDGTATVRNGDGRTLLAQLFPRLRPDDLGRFDAEPGVFSIMAKGVPERELAANALIEAAGLRWTFDGQARFAEAGLDLSGTSKLKAKSIAAGLGLIGMRLGERAAASGFDLTGRLAKTGQAYDVTGLRGHIAGTDLQGKMRFDLGAAKPKLDGILDVSEASLPHLLGLTLNWSGGASADAVLAQAVAGGSDFWSDKTFNAALLDAVDGQLVLTTERLRLAEGFTVADATIEAELNSGTFDLQTIKGGLFGGTLTASGQLTQRGGGVGFAGKMSGKDMKLAMATADADGEPLARGVADFDVLLFGEGLSPRGLVAGLTGEGRLALGEGHIYGLSPAALAGYVDGSRSAEPPSEQALAKQVAEQLKGEEFAFAPVTVPFGIRNGTARLQQASLTGVAGVAAVSTYLEFASLKLDSEWTLMTEEPDPAEVTPEVSVVFSGPLSEFGHIAPQIDAKALHRYITMRRLERDVERLEELDVGGPRGIGAPPLPEPRVRVVPHGPSSMQASPGSESPPRRPQREAAPRAVEAPAREPVPSLPIRPQSLRAERSPSASPTSPSSVPGAGEIVRVPLEPLSPASGQSSLVAPNQPAAPGSAAASPSGEAAPWRVDVPPEQGQSDTASREPNTPATTPQENGVSIFGIPRAPRPPRQPRARQQVPWQAEVFGQPSN